VKNNPRKLTFIILILIISLSIIPFVHAKPRKNFLTDYIINRQLNDEGFSNSIKENDTISYEATVYGLEILSYYNLYTIPGWFGEVTTNVNTTVMGDNLEKELKSALNQNPIDLYDIYFLLKALDLLNRSISSTIKKNVEGFLTEIEQTSGGFSPNNATNNIDVIATCFAILTYDLIGKDVPDKDNHIGWIKSCQNSDGGYGGNSTLSSSIYSTYCAVLAIITLENVDLLDNKDKTVEYLQNFYVDDENDAFNYGGYKPDEHSKYALISSTYFCTRIIYLLDKKELHNETTSNWIIQRQNFKDGGFADNTDGNKQKVSSVVNSYYAFAILKYTNNLNLLEEDVWVVEFNWIILIIVLSVIGVAIAVIIILWRRRKI